MMKKILFLFLFLAFFAISSANAAKNETQSNLNERINTMNDTSVKDYEAVKKA